MRRKAALKIGLVAVGIAVQLLTAGCKGGSGGLFSGLFGGDSGSSGGGFDGLAGNAFNGGLGGGGLGGGGGQTLTPAVAVVHNPEPASMALFGGGVAGLAFLRRRKARRRSP